MISAAWFIVFDHQPAGDVIGGLPTYGVAVVTAMVAVLLIVENRWPDVRVPDGAAYRPFGNNRYVATGIQGAALGGTAGLIITLVVAHTT